MPKFPLGRKRLRPASAHALGLPTTSVLMRRGSVMANTAPTSGVTTAPTSTTSTPETRSSFQIVPTLEYIGQSDRSGALQKVRVPFNTCLRAHLLERAGEKAATRSGP